MTAVLSPIARPRRSLTPLGQMTVVQGEITSAFSADGQWAYDRNADDATWQVLHVATGVVRTITLGLDEALDVTSRPDALKGIRTYAERNLEVDARARLILDILDGTVLPPSVEVEARCYCGGYVTRIKGRWIHVDTCEEELDREALVCPDARLTHRVCDRPEAGQCEHAQCKAPDNLWVPCEDGHQFCCGCKHEG